MKTRRSFYWRSFSFYFLLAIISFKSNAQKLPQVQTGSLLAPVNTKVDGNAIEWGEQLNAYNKNTDTFYTIANDNDNFYLIIQANKPRVIQKIIMAGITFSLNGSGKKAIDNSASIRFPLISYANSRHILIDAGIIPNVLSDRPSIPSDSLTTFINKTLISSTKEIKITNIKAITDTIADARTSKRAYFRTLAGYSEPGQYIAVDNKDGIKVMARFNDKKILTYELAIPIKYLGLIKDSRQKFAYNVTLNGLIDSKGGQAVGVEVIERQDSPNGPEYDPNQDLDNATDFWGEYTLAKKQ